MRRACGAPGSGGDASLRLPPGAAVAGDEGVRFRRTPRAGLVAGQAGGRSAPGVDHGLEQLPRTLDPVAARVERGVTMDDVQQQALVGFRRLASEDLVVLELQPD